MFLKFETFYHINYQHLKFIRGKFKLKIQVKSKNNETIKMVHKLLSSAKFRNKEKKFLIEGVRICQEALKSKVKITKIFYTENCFEKFSDLINEIITQNNADEYVISESILNLITDTKSPQGIICLCEMVDKQVNMAKIKSYSNIILLENLQNPSNLGSIFRSLCAFNTQLVALSHDTCDIYNPKVIRGSMGAIFKLNIITPDDFHDFIFRLKDQGFKVCAAMPDADSESVTILNEISKKAVILGNEGNGISEKTVFLCDKKINIPMNPNCESLSVAVAASIISWEMSGKEN